MPLASILTGLSSSLFPIHEVPMLGGGDDGVPLRDAAVLVLLFPGGSGLDFLLTVRPDTLTRHPGQISLPGGVPEPHDADLWETALRETREELGVRTGRVRPLGRLEPVPVTASQYLIHPFVAWNPVAPVLRPDPREVAAVIEVPLTALLDPAATREETWELRGTPWVVTFYRLGEATVWGATARILSSLAARLQTPAGRLAHLPGSVRPV